MIFTHSPKNFSLVEPGVYRSSAFTQEHYHFLRTLKLKTCLYLSQDAPPQAIDIFCREQNVKLLQFNQSPVGSDWRPLRTDVVKLALECILDEARLPIMVVCISGAQQTGALVGCLRRLQGWCFTSIVEEHRRYLEPSSRSLIEHFVEMFDVEIVNVDRQSIPEWFKEDMVLLAQEEQEEREAKKVTHVF